jgi:U3 small nucleolar RNA-associated protein 4
VRCFEYGSRFLDHVPHAIESVDAEHGPDGRLAVLRANADIEVWCMRPGETHCELRIAGAVDTPVRRVAWGARSPRRPEGRLFSCALHGLVTEWDLSSLSPHASWDSLGGAAWTMAVHVGRQLLAVGCEDGGCSIFDISDEELAEPRLIHRTPPQGGRLLCVSFSPQGSHLVCSAADGSVRVWHVPSWQALSRFVLESDGRRKPPLVWSVILLADLTTVTGDSTGHVCFYDGRHGTLIRRFASHQADVLALTASADESRVFASGVDQKVVCFCPQPPPPSLASEAGAATLRDRTRHLPPPPRGWLLSFSRRPHTHDVRALTTYEPRSETLSRRSRVAGSGAGTGRAGSSKSPRSPTAMLISGGIDTQLCLLPLADSERAQPLKLLPFPQRGSLDVARASRLLLSHNSTEVHVWQLPALAQDHPSAPAHTVTLPEDDSIGSPRKLLLLRPKLTLRNISCASISDQGRWLGICDSHTPLPPISGTRRHPFSPAR